MALKANRTSNTGASSVNETAGNLALKDAPVGTTGSNVTVIQPPASPAPVVNNNISEQIANLSGDVLGNIDGMGNAGNFVSMDGSDFIYKSLEITVPTIDLIVMSGKRYYQWVEELADSKTFHDSDVKIDDRYKLKFEIHWEEESSEGEVITPQFHMPTASAMRFIDYVKTLAKEGYGIGHVVTRMSVSRQVQKGTTNRYSRAEFTMIGFVNDKNEIVDVANGVTTVGKK